MRLAREMFRFDQYLQSEETDVNVPKSSAVRDQEFFEKEEETVFQGYESIQNHYRKHLEEENNFILDDVTKQLKESDIALVDWKYIEYYLCPSNKWLRDDERDKIFDKFISRLLKKSEFRKILLSSEKLKAKYLSESQYKYQERSHMLYIAPKTFARKVNFSIGVSSPFVWPLILILLLVVQVLIQVFVMV